MNIALVVGYVLVLIPIAVLAVILLIVTVRMFWKAARKGEWDFVLSSAGVSSFVVGLLLIAFNTPCRVDIQVSSPATRPPASSTLTPSAAPGSPR